MVKSLKELESKLKEIPDCSMFFKIYAHRKLLRMQRLLSENESVGRYDPVAGLVAQDVVLKDQTRPSTVCCIGDRETLENINVEGIVVFPAKPKLAIPCTVKIAHCQLFIPKRDNMEVKLIESMSRQFPKENKSEIRIIQRQLKLGK